MLFQRNWAGGAAMLEWSVNCLRGSIKCPQELICQALMFISAAYPILWSMQCIYVRQRYSEQEEINYWQEGHMDCIKEKDDLGS